MAAAALSIVLMYSAGATAPAPQVSSVVQQAISDLVKRHPATETNPAALELEELAADLGIDLAPQLPRRRHPSEEAGKRFEEAHAGSYVTEQIERSDDAIQAPPAALAAFLTARETSIRKVARKIVEGSGPRWELDVRKGWGAPTPNFQGQIRLQKLLIAQALVDERQGRAEDSARAMEASWTLNDSLIGRPDLLSQLIAIAAVRLQVGALRHMSDPLAVWTSRLGLERLRSSVIGSVYDDGVFVLIAENEEVRRSEELAAYVEGMRRASEALAAQDPCGFSREFADEFWKSFFVGQESAILGEIAMPNISNALHRMFRLLVAAELTSKLIEARDAKRESSDGRWPSALPDSDSRACFGSRWSYALSVDGGITIAFAGPIAEWPDDSGPKLPLSFSASSHP